MKIRQNIGPKQVLSLFVQLYKFIYYWKINDKNIADGIKLIKKLV